MEEAGGLERRSGYYEAATNDRLIMNRIALAILILLFAVKNCETQMAPPWFSADDNDPYSIFQAWKFLSARDAVLYLGIEWKALGGLLRDETGAPLPLTPILLFFNTNIRSYSAKVMTDKDGYFILQRRESPTHSRKAWVGMKGATLRIPPLRCNSAVFRSWLRRSKSASKSDARKLAFGRCGLHVV